MSSQNDPLAGLYADEDPLAGLYADEDVPTTQEAPKNKDTEQSEQAGRVAAQYGLGVIQSTPAAIAYDISVAPLNTEGFYVNAIQQRIVDDIESLYDKKAFGLWTQDDEKELEFLRKKLENPQEIASEVQDFKKDLSIQGLIEKGTGVDLHPQGYLEKVARWTGFSRNPRNIKEILKLGTTPKELTKAMFPYPTEVFRGIGAGAAWQMAEDGQFGPIGTLAATIIGDIAGHGPKALYSLVTKPKETAARVVNLLTMNNSRRLAAQQLAQDFAANNIKIDAGTLTNSPLIQMMQARLTQSGLTGTALDNFRKELSSQITTEYKNILEDIGEISFENSYQASEAIKNALKVDETASGVRVGNLTKEAKESPSLQGRIRTEERPDYQQRLLNEISETETPNTYQGGKQLKVAAEAIKRPIKEDFKKRYAVLESMTSQIDSGPQVRLANELSEFVINHSGSLLLGQHAVEAKVLNVANSLLKKLRDKHGSYYGVSVDELVKSKRTLGGIADWKMANSDFRSAYKKLYGDVISAIDNILAEHPDILMYNTILNSDYSNFKTIFENSNLQKLFNPKNHNYNTIYREFASDPDKLKSLEAVLSRSEEGTKLLNQVKRDYANSILNKKSLNSRDIRDLQSILGHQFDAPMLDYIADRQYALENPAPRITQQSPLGLNVKAPETQPTQKIQPSRVSETGTKKAQENLKSRYLQQIEGKTPEQILNEMDSIGGIRRLKQVLSTTPEGKEVFKQLSRFKLAELIDRKMADNVTDQVKLGTFSNLLDAQKSKDIVKELLSPEAYQRLIMLQKNSGRLSRSAAKFFNASQSGTTLTDMGLVGTAATGIIIGNPYLAAPAIIKIGGSYILARLLSDPVFLKELEKAITETSTKGFYKSLERMRPSVQAAMRAAQEHNE